MTEITAVRRRTLCALKVKLKLKSGVDGPIGWVVPVPERLGAFRAHATVKMGTLSDAAVKAAVRKAASSLRIPVYCFCPSSLGVAWSVEVESILAQSDLREGRLRR